MKKRSVLLSVLTLMLCLALIASGTYALFSTDAEFSNHLEAGKLEIELWRTKLESVTLNSNGYFAAAQPDTTPVNFTGAKDENVFGLKDKKIVPLCSYDATMENRNKGDVACNYWLEIVMLDENNRPVVLTDNNLALAQQVQVTVVSKADPNKKVSAFLGDILEENGSALVGSQDAPVGSVGILDGSNVAEFTIHLEFVDIEDAQYAQIFEDATKHRNDAQAGMVTFDLKVHAVQVTRQTVEPSAPLT